MFILQYYTFVDTNTTIANTRFRDNIDFWYCHGAAIAFYWISLYVSTNEIRLTPLYIFNTSFLNHQGIDYWPINSLDYGAVYIGIVNPGDVHINIRFSRCTFLENFVATTGACLYATVYQFADNTGNVSITLDSTIATKNSKYIGISFVSSAGIFYFHGIAKVEITGTSIFSNNYGSVISSKGSNVYLSGNLTLNNNHATNGPVILLVGNCQLHFMSEVIATFTNNRPGLLGGAIHARSNGKCAIHIDVNVQQVMFSDNEAGRGGMSIYAEPLFSCYINNSDFLKSPHEVMTYYYQHFNFTKTKSNSSLLQVSTIPNIIDGMIVFSLYNQPSILTKSVKIHPCPLGFDLNKIKGICELSSSFDNLRKHNHLTVPIIGNVSSQTITRPLTFISWAGTIEYENKTKTQFGVSLTCPIGYCDNNHTLPYFYSGDLSFNKSFKLSDGITDYHPPLCLYQREGTLCGRCSEGLSVVFGSTECHHCSNSWIATISIYILAGPLLIYLLFALRLTLTTGTFNGVIFYAQAANVGILDMLSVYNAKMEVVREFSIVLLSVLNLGLGFPLCFYNGMTELWKTGLSLLFPLYLLTIVVVLIILTHFSVRLSNKIAHSSVQVLVTIVHISFGRLLGSIINTFTPAKVYTSEQTYHVWYWDGSVEYGNKGHITLMIITSLVVFPLLLPSVLLLLFNKPLRHWTCANEYTRPILEAIHAPYKNNKEYWFVARLLLLIVMYILYSIGPYAQVIFIAIASILFLFIIGQDILRPYKSNVINLLECWILFNFVFVYITTWYLRHMEVIVFNIAILLFL